VVTVDDLLPAQKDALVSGEDVLVTIAKDLKLEFMYKKSLELSVSHSTSIRLENLIQKIDNRTRLFFLHN
jgi:hypothetical protein